MEQAQRRLMLEQYAKALRALEEAVATDDGGKKSRGSILGTSKNLLRGPIAALRGARSLAYLLDMSRSLRSGRLALGPLATVFRGSPC